MFNSLHYLVPLPSGGPTEGVRGSAEAVGEEDFGGGENEAAGPRGETKGCGRIGKTSEPVIEATDAHS